MTRFSCFAQIFTLVFLCLDTTTTLDPMTNNPRITTKYGELEGFLNTLSDSVSVAVFLGVPYATPPIKELRYVPPVTPPPWKSVREAKTYSNVCPQNYPDVSNITEALKVMSRPRMEFIKSLIPNLRNQSEDCLYLNIYVPKNSKFI